MNRSRKAVLTFCLTFVLCLAGAGAATAHITGSDHRTNVDVWLIATNVPSTWHTALINSALTWDNVPSQCHDFHRITSGTPEMTVYRDNVDGEGSVHAFASASHNAVTFDSREDWNYDINRTSYPSGLDVWGVGTHEFGHNLSLVHSSSTYPWDTMAARPPSGATSFIWRSLEPHDQVRERNLYPGC
jgi:hypothetical protein